MKSISTLKLPSSLDLGTVLPGHYGQSMLPLASSEPAFLTLTLPQKSISNGFFLLKEGSSECSENLNVVVKPGKSTQIFVGCYPRQVMQHTELRGQVIVTEPSKEHKIKLVFRIEVPKISCKKMLEDTSNSMKMVRLVVNKAVTSDVRVPLFNSEEYPLELTAGLLQKTSIADKQNPFILKTGSSPIKAEPNQPFFVFITINTNIGYKNDPKGLKKVVFRNVLTLTTNSILLWCLPLEIIVVFVKQPQFKADS